MTYLAFALMVVWTLLAVQTATLRSLYMAYGKGVVRWRGREYRREDTRF